MTTAATKTQMSASGLNLLRFVLSSYFIGVALGLINGTNLTALAALILPTNAAAFAANTAVVVLAYFVLMGIWLRPAALLLAAFVIGNSGYVTFLHATPDAMSDFWRDVALMAGLMMTYLQSGSREANRRALIRMNPIVRRIKPVEPVRPRRVTASGNVTRLTRPDVKADFDAEIVNIFAA